MEIRQLLNLKNYEEIEKYILLIENLMLDFTDEIEDIIIKKKFKRKNND